MEKLPGLNKIDMVQVVDDISKLNETIDKINEKHYKVVDIMMEIISGVNCFVIYCALMNEPEADKFDLINSKATNLFALKTK